MNPTETLSPVTILGDNSQGGSYILRIKVSHDLYLKFGKFKKRKTIFLPKGEYAYIGSALATKGAMSLALRLVRHSTRSGKNPPHSIRAELIKNFKRVGLGTGNLLPKTKKTLYWNVDYLLDQMTVELTHLILIRSLQRLETELGKFLEHDPHTSIIEKGLGANDLSGNTHILYVEADEQWWFKMIDLARLCLERPVLDI